VAICCVFTGFDIYSSRSRTFACRIKPDKFEFDPIPDINQLFQDENKLTSAKQSASQMSHVDSADSKTKEEDIIEEKQEEPAADAEKTEEGAKTDEAAAEEAKKNEEEKVASAKSEHHANIVETQLNLVPSGIFIIFSTTRTKI